MSHARCPTPSPAADAATGASVLPQSIPKKQEAVTLPLQDYEPQD